MTATPLLLSQVADTKAVQEVDIRLLPRQDAVMGPKVAWRQDWRIQVLVFKVAEGTRVLIGLFPNSPEIKMKLEEEATSRENRFGDRK
jgi:hypothetical protein